MIDAVFNAVAPVIAVALIGYVWARDGKTLDSRVLTPLVTEISVPCLVFGSLAGLDLPLSELGAMAGASVATLLCTGLAGYALLRLANLNQRAYLPALIFTNAGNLGLSLSLLAFGETGLAYAMTYFVVMTIAHMTVGRSFVAGRAWFSDALKSFILPAVLLGLAAAWFQIKPPVWIMSAVSLVGAVAIPLMLIMLGAALATLKLRSVRRAAWLSAARIVGGAAIGFAVAAMFGLDGVSRAILVMMSSMPAAVMNYAFAEQWDAEPEEVASIVAVSTLMSIVTIPLILGLLISM